MSGEKPPEILQDAIAAAEGDEEARKRQRRRGSAGGKVAAQRNQERKEFHEAQVSVEEEQIAKSEEARLRQTYPDGLGPDGEELPEGWYEDEARNTARAIMGMKKKMKEKEQELLKKLGKKK